MIIQKENTIEESCFVTCCRRSLSRNDRDRRKHQCCIRGGLPTSFFVKQDTHLNKSDKKKTKCIFKGNTKATTVTLPPRFPLDLLLSLCVYNNLC